MTARTRHLAPDGSPKYTNRLARETSPYLLQHAHNPVDWHPWGPEAFGLARGTGRPIFLSVGYSTCHWCHVMEEESFEDEEIARILNEQFVPVKVDREERPDVDAVYMQAVQMLTRHGGWPMSVFLAPDGRPFHAGTYFPPRDGDRGARYGFRTILLEIARIWREDRDRVSGSAAEIANAVRESLAADAPAGLPDGNVSAAAMAEYARMFDPLQGGVRRAPKFPSSLNVRFLLRFWQRTGDETALRMAAFTLEKMALGGIYDHVGGGFHRYSTDAAWLVPHFEKMLYDNALLVPAYLEAHQATGHDFFRRVALDVLAYLDREMSDASGAFFSATDADSEGHEGTFFVWTEAQLRDALGPEDAERAADLFGVTPEGNFEGSNVLSLSRVPSADEQAFLDRVRPILCRARASRPPPLTDTKILTAWNGLTISAFARAGLVERAVRAADAVLRLNSGDGVLRRTGRHPGLLDDHAFLGAGCVDLFEATGEARWLRTAIGLYDTLEERFADEAGGYFRTPVGHEELIAREKPAYDGAEPTGNSVAALTLQRLSLLTGEDRFRVRAERLLRAFGALLAGAPIALGEMLLAVELHLSQPREVVLVRPPGGSDAALLSALRARFLPSVALVRHEDGTPPATPLAAGRPARDGKPTAYVCVQGACGLPVTSAGELVEQLG